MLPKQYRLQKQDSIPLFKTGKRFFYKSLLFIYQDSQEPQSRVCIIVHKKGETAVKRNRTERLLREAVFTNIKKFNNSKLIIIITSAKNNTDFRGFQTIISEAFVKLWSVS